MQEKRPRQWAQEIIELPEHEQEAALLKVPDADRRAVAQYLAVAESLRIGQESRRKNEVKRYADMILKLETREQRRKALANAPEAIRPDIERTVIDEFKRRNGGPQ